jgi:hypothetical protein
MAAGRGSARSARRGPSISLGGVTRGQRADLRAVLMYTRSAETVAMDALANGRPESKSLRNWTIGAAVRQAPILAIPGELPARYSPWRVGTKPSP